MNCYISVIICTYNREAYLQESLACIGRQILENENFELVVINNNSSDSTHQICMNFGSEMSQLQFKYFIEETPGLSYARNRGIKESSGNVLVFLDDDAMASESYLSEIHSYFSEHEQIISGGGKILPEYESKSPEWMSSYLLPVVSALDLGEEIIHFPKNKYPIGANMFFRRSFFDQYGVFKTDLGRKGNLLLGGEEKDVFQRLKQGLDGIIYLPKAVVRHIVPEERLKQSYIDNIATGVGISEIIRVGKNKGVLARVIFKEIIKWAGSLVLFFFYTFKFKYSKGRMLIRFRYFVSMGIIKGINYNDKNSKGFK